MTLRLYLSVAGRSAQRHATLPTHQIVHSTSTTPFYTKYYSSTTLNNKAGLQYYSVPVIPHEKHHKRLRLPQKVTREHHQTVHLPRIWLYYDLTLLLLDLFLGSTSTWHYYHLTLLWLNSTRLLLNSIIFLLYDYMTLWLLDSPITWLYYDLTLLLLDSTITWPITWLYSYFPLRCRSYIGSFST